MSALARAAAAAQWIVGVGAATAVVLLFSLDGAPESADAPTSPEMDILIAEGEQLYAQFCSSCHGSAGQGGVGPPLAGTVTVNYPDAADEIDIVTNGRLAMPPFGSALTEDEIAAVVAFTRGL